VQTLDEIAAMFRGVDVELRLQLLLDFANRLPELPERLREQRDAGMNRVHECMTPLFLFVEPGEEAGTRRLFIDVAEEAPTIRGFAGILTKALDGRPREEWREIPDDLVNRLGLSGVIRMNRLVGIAALLGRLRAAASG
jgi:cysteine desulfuration protein SufE